MDAWGWDAGNKEQGFDVPEAKERDTASKRHQPETWADSNPSQLPALVLKPHLCFSYKVH